MKNKRKEKVTICVKCEQDLFIRVGDLVQCMKCRDYGDIQDVYLITYNLEEMGNKECVKYERIKHRSPCFSSFIQDFCVGRRNFNEL